MAGNESPPEPTEVNSDNVPVEIGHEDAVRAKRSRYLQNEIQNMGKAAAGGKFQDICPEHYRRHCLSRGRDCEALKVWKELNESNESMISPRPFNIVTRACIS